MSQITFVLHELLTWQAILDIVLIAIALFFLYRTLVRLGTWKIFLGILAAFVVFSLASVLNLEGIAWIFQNVSQVAAIALIVIFQPELRKLLEKVVTLQKRKSADSGQTETVAASLWQLAKQHRGAIVVYPGREQIQEKISGGHRLAAEPSVPLIVSIFDPNSPGHDGAMIIEDGRLATFGVRLPISQTSRLPEDYGTRHHAAMGLAEQTDALVLVASEERGTVSAFRDGAMRPLESQAEIALAIHEHSQRAGGLPAVEQLGLLERRTVVPIVASVLVATIFWTTLTVVNRQVVVKSLSVPLEYIPPAEGLQLIGEKTEEVRVQLAGPKSEIENFALAQPTAKIDLAGMVEGKQTILITRDQLQLPEQLSILDAKPAQIVVNLAEMVKKTVPVIPQLLGTLPQGLKLKQVKVVPNELPILMPPPKKGQKPPTVSTTPVYLNSVTEESRILCKIIAPPTIQPAVKPWQDVEVIIEVSETNK